jgi:Bacterial SH3 domain
MTREMPLGATARNAKRFALHAQPATAQYEQHLDGYAPPIRSLNSLVVGARTLVGTLALLALLPNLTVAAFVWLPAIRTPPAAAEVKSAFRGDALGADDARRRQAAKPPPVLTAPPILEANAREDAVLTIALDGTDGVPARSVIAINGLPVGATLSSGRPYGATGWNLKPDEIGDLHLLLPDTARGETKLEIQLVAPAGEIIAATDTILRITINSEPAPVLSPPNGEPKRAEAQADQTPQDLGMKTDSKPDGAKAPKAIDEDLGQSASSGSTQTAKDNAGTNSIQPSMFVNLRERPTSSAPVISVIAKDTKLSVLEQKHRWVKVTNPATLESGWIYSRNVNGFTKSRRGSRRARHSDAPSAPDESLWTRMGHWLTGR